MYKPDRRLSRCSSELPQQLFSDAVISISTDRTCEEVGGPWLRGLYAELIDVAADAQDRRRGKPRSLAIIYSGRARSRLRKATDVLVNALVRAAINMGSIRPVHHGVPP